MTATEHVVRAISRRDTRNLQGAPSMWLFVLGDLFIFGAYFVIFMANRTQQPEVFLDSQQHLSQPIGVINTLVLVTSSWFMARAVLAARANNHQRASRLTMLAGACGVLFLAIKAYEWWSKIDQGFTLTHNDFFMFYFMLTGVHLLHVTMGLIIIGIVVRDLRTPALRRTS